MGAFIAELLFNLFAEVICAFTAVVLIRFITLNLVGFESWPPRHPRAIVLPDDFSVLVGLLMWVGTIVAFVLA